VRPSRGENQVRLFPTTHVKEPGSTERGVERHYSRSSSSRNRVRKEGRGWSVLPSIFSPLFASSHARANHSMCRNLTPTSTTMPTSSCSNSQCGDRDGGGVGRRGGTKELQWMAARGEAINRKRGGRRTHYGGS
jgi:hypothetical protein